MTQDAAAQLFETEGNEIPEGAVVGVVTTPDGFVLRYARWEAISRPSKGTVIILHGRSEYIEKYFETVEELRSRGFGVLTFDWRGQGGSQRLLRDEMKGHIEHFNQYLSDLETVLTEVALPDCKPPHYILGHSTGGLVALMAAPALSNRIRRMVLISPLLALTSLPMSQSFLRKLTGFLTFLGFGRFLVKAQRKGGDQVPFISNRLTSDTGRFNRNRGILTNYPKLGIGAPTIGWLFAACRAMSKVNEPGYSSAISIPILMIGAGNDRVVDTAVVETFGNKMRSGAYLTVSGAKHESLHERDVYREQVIAAFDAFVPGTEV